MSKIRDVREPPLTLHERAAAAIRVGFELLAAVSITLLLCTGAVYVLATAYALIAPAAQAP